MIHSTQFLGYLFQAEIGILEADETVNQKLVCLPVDISFEVNKTVMIYSIQFLLYLIAGRNWYL